MKSVSEVFLCVNKHSAHRLLVKTLQWWFEPVLSIVICCNNDGIQKVSSSWDMHNFKC